jgi:PhzF family phenazine biosynthesis protein
MNLSETAFVSKGWTSKEAQLPSNEWTLRWFTPTSEVPLCGHATLASAKILLTHYREQGDVLKFHSKYHGILGATLSRTDDLIKLNFPAHPPKELSTFPDSVKYLESIEQVITATLRSPLIGEVKVSSFTPLDVQFSKEGQILLLRLRSKEDLISVVPDFVAMLEAPVNTLFHMVIVTAESEENGVHFYSRVFCPWTGINEDPVTGSAHTVLTPYWKGILGKGAPQVLTGVQLSARRGILKCELTNGGTRVSISGSSKITLKGEFIL